MQDLKISLITVAYNAGNTISRCIESVIAQDFKNIEYILIDGGSQDGSLSIIQQYSPYITRILSEPDKGIYDAMNKGIQMATGDIVGMLNADDFFSDNTVLRAIAQTFSQQNTEIVYGDLDYVDSGNQVVRKWRSGSFSRKRFNFGWMPPHPTFYCKKHLFEQYGFYSLDYGTAADYELMLRLMYRQQVPAFYLKKVLVKMKIGGASNKSFSNRVKGLRFDFKAMRNHGILLPAVALLLKPLRKITQFF